jgi:uncharacterized phosphosugar-binding protein
LRALLTILIILAIPGPAPAEQSRSDVYYAWLTKCLISISADMPRVTSSAVSAARLFVEHDYAIGAWGDPAFSEEFLGRAGGLMPVSRLTFEDRQVAGAIVLIMPRPDHLEQDLKLGASMKRQDNLLILFASPAAKSLAANLDLHFDSVIDTHAADHGGLFADANGKWIIPTDRSASIAALWTWTGEFVAACTRLGKMPVMWQSLSCPGSEQRAAKYKRMKFHEEKPVAVAPGKLGNEYLSELSGLLKSVRIAGRAQMAAVAKSASEARSAGHEFYVCGSGHATKFPPDASGLFEFIPEGTTGTPFKPGDFLFCVGYDAHWLPMQLAPVSDECRKLGGRLAWALTTYGGRPVPGVEPGETVIDQQWQLGDAIVEVPGYDIKILPSSGVISDAVLWMVAADATVPR